MNASPSEWDSACLDLDIVQIRFDDVESYSGEAREAAAAAEYVLAKVPMGNVRLLHELEQEGYRFLATQISIVLDIDDRPEPPLFVQSLARRIDARPLADGQLEELLSKIDADMVDTDRVSLDPALGRDLALHRHRAWVRDEYADPRNVLRGLFLGADLVGFFLLGHVTAEHYFASLAGVFSRYKGSGLGVAAIWKPIEWAEQNGVKRLTTRNSSNNPDSLKTHLALGYRVERLEYILRLHRGD